MAFEGADDAAVGHGDRLGIRADEVGDALDGGEDPIEHDADMLATGRGDRRIFCAWRRCSAGEERGEGLGPALGDLGPGAPGPLADVALFEVGLDHDGPDPDRLADHEGGADGALEVGGDDGVDGPDGRRCRPRLLASELGEGRVGPTLPASAGVPRRLAVAHEEDPGHGPDGTRPV